MQSDRVPCPYEETAYLASQNAPSEDFDQGPVVQSVFNFTSLLVVEILTVLVSTMSNSQVFFAERNVSATHIFSAKILAYMPYLIIKVLTIY